MTDRITQNKQDRIEDVISELNIELHPLVTKAVLFDPNYVNMTAVARVRVLEKMLLYIRELIALVV